MSAWKKYQIGNILRGFVYFKARSLQEAWRRGCTLFNRACPSTSRAGRLVILSVLSEPTHVPTTAWVLSEAMKRPKDRSYSYQPGSVLPFVSDYIAVASGSSKQQLIFPSSPRYKRAVEHQAKEGKAKVKRTAR